MRTIAILPVKRFGAAKQRLAPALAAGPRRALAEAMLTDVLAALSRVPGLDSVVVVTAEPVAAAAATAHGVPVLADREEAGQSAATAIGIRHAVSIGFDRAVLVPGDTPLLDPGELAGLLARREPVVIVPDRHGTGTNALVLRPPNAIEPSFGPGSRERHVAAAVAAGLEHAIEEPPTLTLDVDTADDLAALAATLDHRRGEAPATRAALRELGAGAASRGAVRPSRPA
jgi:2-phospho-L-lactate/phosphoenolpyruvate guanylyltransferase